MIVKKKLRDVTPYEFYKWYTENCWYTKNCDDCFACVFKNVNCSGLENGLNWVFRKDMFSNKFLEQEIEIEEDE